jgi:CHAT domain-containing protein
VVQIFNPDNKNRVRQICASLKPGTTILLYYFDDFVNLCTTIAAEGITIHKMPVEPALLNDLAAFQVLNSHQTMIDGNWCRLSNRIYQGLVEPYIQPGSTKELVIVSAGLLNCIPFESLVTGWGSGKDGKFNVHYLMENMGIRYEYSLEPFLSRNQAASVAGIKKVYAFAPEYDIPAAPYKGMAAPQQANYISSSLRSQSFPLKYNVPEAQMVVNATGGMGFLNKAATEKKFMEVSGNADILHLSMHSYAFNENPMYWGLVFAKNNSLNDSTGNTSSNPSWADDGTLYAYEIYQMNLKSDMVVLSACETGIGQYVTGEGTRSLGLAFRYAGCNNTVMSLWSVDDKYTEELMGSFYHYLEEGSYRAEALTFAKRDFVKMHNTAGPFFWAGFILYGDNQAVHFEKPFNFSILLIIGFTVILIAGLEVWRRKNR